jgi:beta-carotene 15,15'-dioxygenase
LADKNSEILGAWLLLVSALFFGLPHGAYDFWILLGANNHKSKPWRSLLVHLSIYLSLALSVIAIWWFFPSIILIAFLGLTAWHFGSGDAIWANNNRFQWILESIGRGLIIISAPLTFYPLESGFVLSKLDTFSSEWLILVAPIGLIIGIVLFLTRHFYNFEMTQNALSLLEIAFLLLFFWLTTPLLAVTIYLIGVHSWRHLLRLDLYENEQSMPTRSIWKIIQHFHARALPITVISLFGLGIIYWMWSLNIADLANYTSAYLVLLSALTLPHAILITQSELTKQISI